MPIRHLADWLSAAALAVMLSLAPVLESAALAQTASAVRQPDVRANNQILNLASLGATLTFSFNNAEGTFGFTVVGLNTSGGAALTPQSSIDGGGHYVPITVFELGTGNPVTSVTADGQYRANIGGTTSLQLVVAATGTGTATTSWSASSVPSMLTLTAPINIGAVVATQGGAPWSVNVVGGSVSPTTPTVTSTPAPSLMPPSSLLPGSHAITDGKNYAAVTSPFTTPTSSQPAIVVALSPNSAPFSVTASNPSVGSTGAGVPGQATYIAVNNGGTLTGLTNGQQLMAGSLPVVIASNQSTLPITGTVSLTGSLPGGTAALGTVICSNCGTSSSSSSTAPATTISSLGSLLGTTDSYGQPRAASMLTDGKSYAAVAPANTTPDANKPALVVTLSPNSAPLSVTGSVTASNASIAPAGGSAPGSATYVGMNVGGAITPIPGTASGVSVRDAADMTGTAPGTAPTTTQIVGGIFNSAPPSPTTGQTMPVQLDNGGRLIVACTSGCGGSGGTSLADQSVFAVNVTSFTPSGGFYNSGFVPLTTGQGAAVLLTPNRAFTTNNVDSTGRELAASLPGRNNVPYQVALAPQLSGPAQLLPAQGITDGRYFAGVTGPGAAATSYQPALAVTISPNTTAVPVTGTVTSLQGTSPWAENVTQFGGSPVVTGNGSSGAGIPRVTIANDSSVLANQAGTWNVGIIGPLPAGANSLGSVLCTNCSSATTSATLAPTSVTAPFTLLGATDRYGQPRAASMLTDGTDYAGLTTPFSPPSASQSALVVALSPNANAVRLLDTSGVNTAAINSFGAVSVTGGVSQGSTTLGQTVAVIGCAANATPPGNISGTTAAASCGTNGALNVNVVSGSSGSSTSTTAATTVTQAIATPGPLLASQGLTDGRYFAAFAAPGTAAAATQPALVVTVSPNTPALPVTIAGSQAVNLAQLGGAALALGQAQMSGSIPVVIAANQAAIPVTCSTCSGGSSTSTTLAATSVTPPAMLGALDRYGQQRSASMITDGGSYASVTGPGAASSAASSALVVAVSPNSPLPAGNNGVGLVKLWDGNNVAAVTPSGGQLTNLRDSSGQELGAALPGKPGAALMVGSSMNLESVMQAQMMFGAIGPQVEAFDPYGQQRTASMLTDGRNYANIAPPNTAADATKQALVVTISPNSAALAITGSITASNPSVASTGGAVPASATYAAMNVAGTLTGLTGTASGLKVDPSGVTSPVKDAADMTGTTPGTAPASTTIVGGIFNTGAPAPTTGQTLPFQLDSAGRLVVACSSGCAGSGGTSLADQGTYTQNSSSFTPTGGFYSTSVTPLITNQAGAVLMTANRAFTVDPVNSAGQEIGTTLPGRTAPALQVVQASTLAMPSLTSATMLTDGKNYAAFATPGNAATATQPGLIVTLSPNSAQVAVGVSVNGVPTALSGGQQTTANSLPVVIASNQPPVAHVLQNGAAVELGGSLPGRYSPAVQVAVAVAPVKPQTTIVNPLDALGNVSVSNMPTDGKFYGGLTGPYTAATTDKPAQVVAVSPNPSLQCPFVQAFSQTTSARVVPGQTGRYLHVCWVGFISSTAQSVSLSEGTGAACATGKTTLYGGSGGTAAFAANGGLHAISDRITLPMQVRGDDLCVEQSSTGNVSGTIVYGVYS